MKERIWLALFLITFPCVGYVSTLPPQRFRNEITQWGNPDSQANQDYLVFRDKFGVNETVVLTWPDCTLLDTRIDCVVDQLESELADEIRQVDSGRHLLGRLVDEANLSEPTARRRLENIVFRPGSDQTAIGFQLSELGRSDRSHVVDRLHRILEGCGVDPGEVAFAGLGHNLYMMDKEGLESPFRMVPLIMALCLTLTWLFVRHVWTALFVNALGVYVGCVSFNVVHFANVDMNAIIWPLPTLTMLLSVSASLHFMSYYRKAAVGRGFGRTDSSRSLASRSDLSFARRRVVARRAVRESTPAILCCTATTAIGLLSLLLSTSEPVRQFGVFGASSIVIGNGLLIVWFPAFMTCVGSASRAVITNERSHRGAGGDRWGRFAVGVGKYRRVIVGIGLALLVLFLTGIPKLKTGSGLENFFPAGHEVLTDEKVVAEACGPLNSIELLLTFRNADQRNDRSRIRGLDTLGKRIVDQTAIESCVSAATFSPRLDRQRSGMAKVSQSIQIRRLKATMIESGMLAIDPGDGGQGEFDDGTQTWRVSCRYNALASIDIGFTSKQLVDHAHAIFQNDGELVFDGEELDVVATGEFVLFESIDKQFFRELLTTYLTAFVAITLVIVIMLRSVGDAVIALMPNLFPAVVVLGAAGLFGFSLDAASLMTASLALGIAVDDTIHFLLWQRNHAQHWNDDEIPVGRPHDNGSIPDAMRYCGTAMLQTSIILGASVCLYGFCGFLPTVRFGCLLSAMMLVALAGDLLLLPALLLVRSHLASDV